MHCVTTRENKGCFWEIVSLLNLWIKNINFYEELRKGSRETCPNLVSGVCFWLTNFFDGVQAVS
jgi:hypothetical protein